MAFDFEGLHVSNDVVRELWGHSTNGVPVTGELLADTLDFRRVRDIEEKGQAVAVFGVNAAVRIALFEGTRAC
jgi:hypothetical protein